MAEKRLADAVDRAAAHSPFLRLQLEQHPRIAELLASGSLAEALAAAEAGAAEPGDVGTALRRRRNAVSLALAIGDLAGLLPLETVVEHLSELADTSLDAALEAIVERRTPGAGIAGFAVVALGKLGSRELNFSSDVDVIFLFDPARLALRPREDAGEAAVRIGQSLVELLQKRTSEGLAFRVDLRLRPSSEITPIALSVNAAISYYESSALAWERAAFIRARPAAGDRALGAQFLEAIHPFVWRRSLDFGAIDELQSITRQIRAHYPQGQRFGPGFDLKRGRGGIREIEFFAQIHQLIHGGRDPALRGPATLDALEALRAAGHVTETEAATLADSYRLLRTIEHRLQMVDDRQTHALPMDPAALDGVARLHGLVDGAALLSLLEAPVRDAATIYDKLGIDETESLPLDPATLEQRLAEAGFEDPIAARLRIESWRAGKARSLRTSAARAAFEAMLPGLVAAFGASPHGMQAMNRFDDIILRLPSAVNFYRLLQARPALAQLLATVLSHAPALADQLGRRAELLDRLIDATAFEPAPSAARLVREFSRSERPDEEYEQVLDRVRRRVNEARFALGVQLIVGHTDPLEVAGGYARVAEAALQVLADAAIAEFEKVHGRVPDAELVILGLGRLGGEALTHASDLDLVYLFTGSHESVSDGPKPLRASDYFNRLAPRVTAALSVPTAAGPLYEVDTRLRPSGKDGLIAVSLSTFADYQRDQAWTWEHMALTRARPVFGSAAARGAVQQVIDASLAARRDPARLTRDAVTMRREMVSHKPPRGRFDIKLGEGGLVDLEFAVHVIQLRSGVGLVPQLEPAIEALADAGLVPDEIVEAHRLLTRMLVTLRLVCPESGDPPPASQALVARACRHEDWASLVAAHDEARAAITALWSEVSASADPAAS